MTKAEIAIYCWILVWLTGSWGKLTHLPINVKEIKDAKKNKR